MRYWKNLQWFGVVKPSETKPTDNGYWVEVTAREYKAYKAKTAEMVKALEKAVARKKAVLGVE